jgi:hypothetical protein
VRFALLIALAAAIPSAEVVRRDLQFSLGSAATDFDYTITSPGGTFTGSDGFDMAWQSRLGARWAFTAPGWRVAPVVGADLRYRSADYASGGGLTAMGLGATGGVAWAINDRWSTDLELGLSFEQADLTIDGGSGLSGSGDLTGTEVRARVLYLLDRTWSVGLELGWEASSGTFAGDGDREIAMDLAGWTAGLLLTWRTSMRPAGLE